MTNRRRLGKWALLVPLTVVAIAVTIALFSNDSGTATGDDALELSLGESSALASCLQFDVAILADMPVAFQGTATSVEDSAVTISVDRWFKGGDADAVRLTAEHQSPALIAGFEMEPGEQYLIAATNGTVNYCGYSGPVNPELLAGYEAAFAG